MPNNISPMEQLVLKELIGIPLTSYEEEALTKKIPTDIKRGLVTKFTNPTNLAEIKTKIDMTIKEANKEVFSHCDPVDFDIMDACAITEVYEKKGREYIKAISEKK